MIWKLLGLQKKLDALFDDGWVSLGLSHRGPSPERIQGPHPAHLSVPTM